LLKKKPEETRHGGVSPAAEVDFGGGGKKKAELQPGKVQRPEKKAPEGFVPRRKKKINGVSMRTARTAIKGGTNVEKTKQWGAWILSQERDLPGSKRIHKKGASPNWGARSRWIK